MGKVQIDGYICERCGHKWAPKKNWDMGEPVFCPSCKSAYWNEIRETVVK